MSGKVRFAIEHVGSIRLDEVEHDLKVVCFLRGLPSLLCLRLQCCRCSRSSVNFAPSNRLPRLYSQFPLSQIYLSPAVLIVAANPSLHTWHSSQQHASVSASQQRHSATKGWYGMIESKATIIPVSGNLAILSPGEIVNLNLNPWLYLTHVSNPGLHLWLSINIIFQSMSSDSYMIYVKQNVFY